MARRQRGRARAPKPVRSSLTIERLGAAGDGLAGEVAVPFALPGERVMADVAGKKGRVIEIEESSPTRAVPPCPHFGRPGDACGGCKLQHLQDEGYRAFKAGRLTAALGRAGFAAPAPAILSSPPQSRRRAKLAFFRQGKAVRFGFRALQSHAIVPLRECHVLRPELFALAEGLCGLLRALPWQGTVEAFCTLTETGADVDLLGLGETILSFEDRERAADAAETLDLARLSVEGVPLAERRTPVIDLGGVPVGLPAGSFLQATKEGEEALIRLVCDAAGDARTVADLFCGAGTFSLPLARRARVIAAEGAADVASALRAAAGASSRPIEVLTRDLFERPLGKDELQGAEMAVLDPPRAGAAAQTAALAEAGTEKIVYVSCDPANLSRDARILAPCYDLTELTLVDQFVWSPHIEAVAVFERKAR